MSAGRELRSTSGSAAGSGRTGAAARPSRRADQRVDLRPRPGPDAQPKAVVPPDPRHTPVTDRQPSPQRTRIARLLATDAELIVGLEDICEADLRVLHDQISEAYFGPGREMFARVAGLSKVLPGALAGRLAEHFLPAQLGARAAEQLDPARAGDLVNRVSVRYLADMAIALDPTRAKPVLQAAPPQRVAEVAAEMFRRREYAAMAELAGSVTLAGLFAALAVAGPHDLLELVPHLVWDEQIEIVVDRTPDQQLDGVLDEIVAACRWVIGNLLIERLCPAARTRAARRLARAQQPTYDGFCAAAGAGLLDPAAQHLVTAAARLRHPGKVRKPLAHRTTTVPVQPTA